jgi:hypothetical protein
MYAYPCTGKFYPFRNSSTKWRNFFEKPSYFPPARPDLRRVRPSVKIYHAKAAAFAKDFSDLKNNPFRPWRPLRE